jgi:hypothetical protein
VGESTAVRIQNVKSTFQVGTLLEKILIYDKGALLFPQLSGTE